MNTTSSKVKLVVEDNATALNLCGRGDEHLLNIEREFAVQIVPRGNELTIIGSPGKVDKVKQVLESLLLRARGRHLITPQEVAYAISLIKEGEKTSWQEIGGEVIQVTARGKQIRPKTLGQKRYIESIKKHGIVFCIGPAGTGKTYLAMAMAIAGLKRKEYGRIILTRPAVEAGENLGFLPGDLQDKVDPYLRPLYDALYEILGVDAYQKAVERGIIEVAPLAYMRGRTLEDSFIILDEAQNTTPEQMKMFLTRLGFGSKAVITGDITQRDLPNGKESGLIEVQNILAGVEGIDFVYLSERDVVRHPLVQRIINAYERYDAMKADHKVSQGNSRVPMEQEPKLA